VTFEEALKLLEKQDFKAVAEPMVTWHPAVLGQMLRAVAVAKRRRYPRHHPDFDIGVEAIQTAAETPKERLAELDKGERNGHLQLLPARED
jgi:hypothetical protein